MIAIGIVVVFSLLIAVIPLIQTAVTALEALDPAPPTILITLANLWWVPLLLVMVALIVGGGMAMRRRFTRGRSRRR